MPEYKLTYFNARGVAELSRLIFKAAGREFTDERIERENWPKRKGDTPLGALPVLTIDGKTTYCQSQAIARYLATEFDLMGSNNVELLRIFEIEETLVEMMQKEVLKVFGESDEAKKKEIITAFSKEAMQKYLDFVEKRLKENNGGKGFVVGDKLTYGDLIIYHILTMLKTILGMCSLDPLQNRPTLLAYYGKVEAVPNIAAWIKSRPKTDF